MEETPDSVFLPLTQDYAKNNFKYYVFKKSLNKVFYISDWYLSDEERNDNPIKVKTICQYYKGIKHGKIEYFIYDTIKIMTGYYCSGKPCGQFIAHKYKIEKNITFKALQYSIMISPNTSKAEGVCTWYYSKKYYFKNQFRDSTINWHRISLASYVYNYKNGKKHGPAFEYGLDGNSELDRVLIYKNGKIVDGKYLHRNGVSKYKNGELVKNWAYSSDTGRLIRSKERSFFDRFFNFNKLLFPVKRVVTGEMDYEEYVNRKLK
ncbi:hypothetical protein [Salibacter halophilus]|uniref:Toxin-antitoxin system YwqK family antitoxin n=1 Tax=Salibacter halophilus TaxID=1803916 RepID=A0A6N6M2W9_9FLAO|nr:hypothetical protein [Salibacter halophilus]KAB1063490.1 hypothetical protein F3059_10510 [Salibacter halophilus]